MGTALQTFLERVASGGTAWKNACRVVSTSNITMSGLQTIDGVTLEEGDRVLVAGQTLAKLNGVYVASVNKWARSDDFARDSYAKIGTTLRVMEGTGAGLYVLTSPTSGTIRIGTDSLVFSFESSGPPVVETHTPLLTFDRDAIQVAVAQYSRVHIGLQAGATHVPGVTKAVYVDAGTVASSADIVVAADFNTDDWPALDVAQDIVVFCTALPSDQFYSVAQNLGLRDTSAPTITSASVNVGSDPNALSIVFSEAVYLPDLTGISLSFSAGTSRTITAIESCSADSTTWGLTLSGDFDGSETCDLVIGASRTWQDMNDNLIAAGSTSVSVTGAWTTADLTNLKLWIDPGQGHSTTTGNPVSTVTNMGSAGGTFTGSGSTRPNYDANGFGSSLPWFDYDGTDDRLDSTKTLGDIVTDGGEWYFGAVVAVDAVTTDAASDSNNTLLSETAGYFSVMFRSSNGANVYTFDGGTKLVAKSIGTPPVAKILIEARATGGTTYIRVNKGTESSVAAGDVGNLLGALKLGANRTNTIFGNLKHGELWMTAGDPGATERNNQADYIMTKYGLP